MSENNPSFEQQKAQLEREWAIADSIDLPVPDYMKVYEMVLLELKQVIWSDLTVYGIASALADWKKTRNQTYLDLAIIGCEEAGISPTETIQKESALAAKRRLEGGVAESPIKILNAKRNHACYMLMMRLIYVGATLAEASRKAQWWAKKKWPDDRLCKASTLERGYTDNIKQSGIQKKYHASWNKSMSKENEEALKKERSTLQEVDAHEAGVRHQ